ncbi:hypothetical protein, partial [Nonomuraea mesophila]|uniref:hypothetical protein n=1 Tax=Nonomuraea mesophila TaxID=2530382 RepID=UPI001407D228
GAKDSPWIGGGWGTFHDSPISETLAKNVGPYLDQLARGQVKRDSPDLTAVHPTSSLWDSVHPDEASRFMGGLMQDKEAAQALMKASHDYAQSLDIGRFRPFGDEAVQAEYTNRASLAGGAADLMLSGSTYAEWSDDEYADWLATVALLPISWLSSKYWTIQDATVATARDAGLDEAKDGLKSMITDYLDKQTPGTAGGVADQMANRLGDWVNESLDAHGEKPLTREQREEVRMSFRGRLSNALKKALEQRGG